MNATHKRSRDRSKPTQIGSIMSSLVSSLGLSGSYKGWMVVQHWAEIVGEDVAARAVANGYRDGVLYVSVERDVWRQELQMQKETILRKIHELPYGQAIREIRLTGVKKG